MLMSRVVGAHSDNLLRIRKYVIRRTDRHDQKHLLLDLTIAPKVETLVLDHVYCLRQSIIILIKMTW